MNFFYYIKIIFGIFVTLKLIKNYFYLTYIHTHKNICIKQSIEMYIKLKKNLNDEITPKESKFESKAKQKHCHSNTETSNVLLNEFVKAQ